MNKGTVSLWFNISAKADGWMWNGTNSATSSIEILGENSDLFKFTILSQGLSISSGSLFINGIIVGNDNAGCIINSGSWVHLLIVWDRDKNLSDGDSVRVFINAAEVVSTNSDLPDLSHFSMRYKLLGETFAQRYSSPLSGVVKNHTSYTYTQIDNIQIWNDVVTEDPDLFYNNGNGREDVIHSIYGPENGYKPSNVGVGYHYVQ